MQQNTTLKEKDSKRSSTLEGSTGRSEALSPGSIAHSIDAGEDCSPKPIAPTNSWSGFAISVSVSFRGKRMLREYRRTS